MHRSPRPPASPQPPQPPPRQPKRPPHQAPFDDSATCPGFRSRMGALQPGARKILGRPRRESRKPEIATLGNNPPHRPRRATSQVTRAGCVPGVSLPVACEVPALRVCLAMATDRPEAQHTDPLCRRGPPRESSSTFKNWDFEERQRLQCFLVSQESVYLFDHKNGGPPRSRPIAVPPAAQLRLLTPGIVRQVYVFPMFDLSAVPFPLRPLPLPGVTPRHPRQTGSCSLATSPNRKGAPGAIVYPSSFSSRLAPCAHSPCGP